MYPMAISKIKSFDKYFSGILLLLYLKPQNNESIALLREQKRRFATGFR